MLSRSVRLSAKQRATSPTYTGWERAPGLGSSSTGSQRCSHAKVLRNRSSGPKITEGRNAVTARSFCAENTHVTPSPFERRYWLQPPGGGVSATFGDG